LRAGPGGGPAAVDGGARVVETRFHFGALRIGSAGHSEENLSLEVGRFRLRNGAAPRELQGTFNLFSH
jgi:hypothetical protein